ncbi:MAG: PQQ-binding-like beta-propeller repeat protein [Magnetospirillum sp.]|nr:PQQ-binding-like beta-propeller repeat protein [Magnetospirillum sp.]
MNNSVVAAPLRNMECALLHEALRTEIKSRAVVHSSTTQRIVSPTGKEQAWVLDLRPITLDGEILEIIASLFWDGFADRWPFQIGGMETAAIPLLGAISLVGHRRGTPVNAFVVRKERKTSGLARSIEGKINELPVIVVDDIVNSAASLEKVRVVLSEFSKHDFSVFAIVDFHSKRGIDWRGRHGIPITSLFTRAELDLPQPVERPSPPIRLIPAWSFRNPDANHFQVGPKSTPAYDGSHVYFGCDDGTFFAIDAGDGSTRWRFRVKGAGRKGVRSSPALRDGRVYFGAYDGCVYCLDTITGSEIWRFSGADWVGSSPVVAPSLGRLFIGLEHALPGRRGGIAALDLSSGELQWESCVPGYVHGTPLLSPDGAWVACGTNDGELICLDAACGKLLWRYQAGGAIKAAPAFDAKRGRLLAGSFDQCLHAVDAATGAPAWRIATEGVLYTTPFVEEDLAVFGSTDKHLYVVDLSAGTVVGKKRLDGKIFASPQAVSGTILVGSTSGALAGLDLVTFTVTDLVQLPERITNGVIHCADRGVLIIPTHDNGLFCYRIETKEVGSRGGARPAPMPASSPVAMATQPTRGVDLSTAYAEGHYFRVCDPNPDNGAGKPFSILPSRRMFGAATMLMMASPQHRHLSLRELEWLLMPPIVFEQARIFLYGLRPIGLVTWAYFSEEAETHLLSGSRLDPSEWRSGDRLWLMDVVAPFGGGNAMIERVKWDVKGDFRTRPWRDTV